MAASPVLPAFIRAEYDPSGNAFETFEAAAKASVNRTQRTFKASFLEISTVIKSAIGASGAIGRLDLSGTVGGYRQAAAEARLAAVAADQMLESARALAAQTGDTSAQTQAYVAALSAQSIEAQRAAAAADAQATSYERLNASLAASTERNRELLDAQRAVFAEQARAARAELAARSAQTSINGYVAPGLGRTAKSASDSAAIFAEAAALDELRRAEEGAARGAYLLAAAQRGTLLEAGRVAKSARESAAAFVDADDALAGGAASMGSARFASLQLGQQMQDLTVQIVSGQNAMVAFAQQAPQAAFALQGFGGRVGRVAAFLSGPWGAALFAAGAALTMIAGRLSDAGDEAEKAEGKIRSFVSAAALGERQSESFSALEALNQARERLARVQGMVDKMPAGGGRQRTSLQRMLEDAKSDVSDLEATYRRAQAVVDLYGQRFNAAKATEAANDAKRAREKADRATERSARDAAKAQNELADTLDNIVGKFDPAAAAARDYADALERIAELEARGALGKSPEENRYQAAKLRDAAEREQIDRQVREGRARLSVAVERGTEPLDDAALGVADVLEEGGRRAADALRDEGLAAAEAIAQILGGSFGKGLGQLVGLMQGLSSGNYNGLGGALGGALTLLSGSPAAAPSSRSGALGAVDRDVAKTLGDVTGATFRDGLEDVFAPLRAEFGKLAKSLTGIFGEGGDMARSLGQIAAGATLGMAGGGLLGGSGSRTGSAIGGALGQVAGKALGKALGGTLGKVAGPLGSIAGGLVGGLVGGLFKKVKTGSATLGYDQYGNLSVAGTSGNNKDYIRGATNNANSIAGSLDDIASQLGGSLGGSVSVSIGRRKKNYVVDTTGSGRTKGAGTMKFKDEAEALRYAIQDAINDGIIQGLRAGTNRLIKGSGDLERQLEKAVKFENVFKSLKRELDPVGAAIDELNMEFEGLKKIFAEAGASAAEYAQLEQLYSIKRADAIEQATDSMVGSLRGLLDELTVGNDAYSLRDRLKQATATYSPFAADIAAGKAVDYDAFAEAARTMLDLQRELYGSQDRYFTALSEVQSLTTRALAGRENVVSIASAIASPFDTTSTAAETSKGVIDAVGALQGTFVAQLSRFNATSAATLQALQQAAANGGIAAAALRIRAF